MGNEALSPKRVPRHRSLRITDPDLYYRLNEVKISKAIKGRIQCFKKDCKSTSVNDTFYCGFHQDKHKNVFE